MEVCKLLAFIALTPLLSGALPLTTVGSDPVTVKTTYGPVTGEIPLLKGIRTFKGIPYAAPPIGDFRFRPPQPLQPWTKARPAKKFGNICPQIHVSGDLMLGDEDCLYLNIYVPHPLPANKSLPVMFWIYGGGYSLGDGDEFGLYDGVNLAKERQAIVVTSNYRLDTLGFLALDELKKESGTTGNYALQDQRAAMIWVRDNIAAFGGDPSRVLIFGESAGGFSVCWHLASRASAGLFHGAIMESGSCDAPQFFRGHLKATEFSKIMAASVNCTADITAGPALLRCLRAVPAHNLLSAMTAWLSPSWPFPRGAERPVLPEMAPVMAWGPAVDGTEEGLLDTPLALIQRGDFNKVPVMFGTNHDEGTIFVPLVIFLVKGAKYPLTQDTSRVVFEHFFLPEMVDKILEAYPMSQFDTEDTRAEHVLNDYFFLCGTRRSLRAVTSHNVPGYLYQFNFPFKQVLSKFVFGDHHASELRFVFDNQWPPLRGHFDKEYKRMAEMFGEYWGNMAHNLDPNAYAPGAAHSADAVYWPRYNATDDENVVLSIPLGVNKALLHGTCDFWDQLGQVSNNFPYDQPAPPTQPPAKAAAS